ncbi:Hypothetical predicted protein [Octopus vulgaris]|uniref:Uncharacterized protein n=1 Tax=Octopus vulgaris TaxID=6645 RepID=A0AA36ALW8_OCTVU|nr:Hypothetical predicted protein [Octopus vulgaris]
MMEDFSNVKDKLVSAEILKSKKALLCDGEEKDFARLDTTEVSESVVIMSEPTAKKAKLRNYKEDFIMFGFISVDSKPMCLECDAIMKNQSMKKVKLEQHQKLRHLLSVGKGKEYFENKKKIQPIKLPDFVKKINTEKAKILKPGYLVSEIIAKVAAPQIYGEKLVKPACANEVLRKDAASTQSK